MCGSQNLVVVLLPILNSDLLQFLLYQISEDGGF
jgi:hypothetical protein